MIDVVVLFFLLGLALTWPIALAGLGIFVILLVFLLR